MTTNIHVRSCNSTVGDASQGRRHVEHVLEEFRPVGYQGTDDELVADQVERQSQIGWICQHRFGQQTEFGERPSDSWRLRAGHR